MVASGKLLPNRSQITPEFLTENGNLSKITFQEADVQKPLLAVSAINAQGNPVWFDGEKSYIIPAKSVEIAALRAKIEGIRKKVPLHLEQGTFRLRSWAKPPAPFQGPGW